MQINLESLPQLAQDKANHHIYGEIAAALAAWVLPLLALRFGYVLDRRLAAVIGAVGAAAIKEVWDKVTGKGDPSLGDFLATASGMVGVNAGLTLAGLE